MLLATVSAPDDSRSVQGMDDVDMLDVQSHEPAVVAEEVTVRYVFSLSIQQANQPLMSIDDRQEVCVQTTRRSICRS